MSGPVVNSSEAKQRFIGIIVVAVTFGLFGGWSLIAPLQKAALAPGVVALEGNRKTVQHLEGGVVKEILTKDGAQVDAGEVLLRLEDTQIKAQLDIANIQLYTALATEARLRAERNGDKAVTFTPALLEADSPIAKDAIASQSQMFSARQSLYLGEVDVLNQQVQQLNAEVDGMENLRQSKLTLVRSFAEEIADFEALLSDGFAEKTRLRELGRSRTRLAGEAAELVATIAQIKIRIGETKLKILQLKKEFHTAVVEELAKVQTEAHDYQERVAALSDRLKKATILSPVAGKVLGLAAHTIGGVISPGEPILHVVADKDALIIDARVNPMDIDRVQVGQQADIRFSAFQSQTTPVIDGELITVSADALIDEQSGTSYFKARVRVTEQGYSMLGGLLLVPGMPVEVLITTGSRTLFQYMTQPIRNSFARSMIED